MPKAAVPEKKVPEVIPPKPESPPPAGNHETPKLFFFLKKRKKKKNSLLSAVKIFLQSISYTLVNSSITNELVFKVYEEPEEIVPEEPPAEAVEEPEPTPPPKGIGQPLGCPSQILALLVLNILGIVNFSLVSHSSSLILKHKF